MEVLPNDLVRKCLLTVPYKSHDSLKAVCRSWEAMVSSPKFYADRKISGTSEELLCLIQIYPSVDNNNMNTHVLVYDPVKSTSERLPPIDDPHFAGIPRWCKCVAVNGKLVLMGGFHPSNMSLMKSIYIYDFESSRWRRGADMPTPRAFFACSVSSSIGLVYVAGGINEHQNHLESVEACNVEEDKWEILPPMIQGRRHQCHGVFMEGKFMVLCEDKTAEVFDPSEETWRRWEDMLSFPEDPWKSCATVSYSGKLYVFTPRRVMKYDGEKHVWTAVASLLQYVRFVACATPLRDWIFVSGGRALIHKENVSYLFNPSTGQWIEVNVGGGEGSHGMVLFGATLEI